MSQTNCNKPDLFGKLALWNRPQANKFQQNQILTCRQG